MLLILLEMLDGEEENIFLEFYEENKKMLFSVAYKLVGNEHLAENALQEAFISIIKNKDKMLELKGERLKKWSVIIVKNKCIDIMRKEGRMETLHLEDEKIATEAVTEDETLKKYEAETIKRYLGELDELSKQILYLKYLFGYSYKEISQTVNVSEKNAEMRVYRAKNKLREMIAREGIVTL
ncbi:MAG: RNA polymerase sigma factor [Clostridia bacterium]|nr:RNA polymerase sigma factor [Clostridia bacterium]